MQFANLLFHQLHVLTVHLVYLFLLFFIYTHLWHKKWNCLLIAIVLLGESSVLFDLRLGERNVGKAPFSVLYMKMHNRPDSNLVNVVANGTGNICKIGRHSRCVIFECIVLVRAGRGSIGPFHLSHAQGITGAKRFCSRWKRREGRLPFSMLGDCVNGRVHRASQCT